MPWLIMAPHSRRSLAEMTPTATVTADVLRVGDVTLDLAPLVVRIGAAADPLRAESRFRALLMTLRLPELS